MTTKNKATLKMSPLFIEYVIINNMKIDVTTD